MKQLFNNNHIPLPKHINKHALHYPKLHIVHPDNTDLIDEFNWSTTPEGHSFWIDVDEAESIEKIWNIWETKYPGTREITSPAEPRKQPTLNDIFTL